MSDNLFYTNGYGYMKVHKFPKNIVKKSSPSFVKENVLGILDCVIFTRNFVPPNDLADFCHINHILYWIYGWDSNYVRFNQDLVKYCKEHSTGEIYLGHKTDTTLSGYIGCGYFFTVDTTKQWFIEETKSNIPKIVYAKMYNDSYGELILDY